MSMVVIRRLHRTRNPGPDATITIFALTRVPHPATLRFCVQVASVNIVALVDNGLSHNFINREVAKTLALAATPIPPFHVKVANGETLTSEHCYESVTITLQGEALEVDLYELPIQGLDVVLGI
ncbi:unnamed protein product [Linum trigynum]|uniref:Uncharacterized protein n=1 Tax=Linum trigynum TaxID=586398 RepID=A0AAV2DXU3_9ROSI